MNTKDKVESKNLTLNQFLRIIIWAIVGGLLLLVLADVLVYVLPQPVDQTRRRRVASAQIGFFGEALDMFKQENGFYPTGTNGLNDLVVKPAGATNWHQYLEKVPLDSWGHPYIYEYPGKHRTNSYDLSSGGPDGKVGNEDDIVNWK